MLVMENAFALFYDNDSVNLRVNLTVSHFCTSSASFCVLQTLAAGLVALINT